ncbi:hypothetical protein [Streptomyces botrytidirepellens]|uniref:hypothetical protein n=1 Tax=Streptomyces botrytidirepellens TaxID=2486417 RepID=UPI00160CF6F5|nr:hypothetical protein [Streptomyces botrytidirepellens]
MANVTVTHDERPRDLEALVNAVGTPGDPSITVRLDTAERVLFALARVQGIDPDTAP